MCATMTSKQAECQQGERLQLRKHAAAAPVTSHAAPSHPRALPNGHTTAPPSSIQLRARERVATDSTHNTSSHPVCHHPQFHTSQFTLSVLQQQAVHVHSGSSRKRSEKLGEACQKCPHLHMPSWLPLHTPLVRGSTCRASPGTFRSGTH